MSVEWSRVVGVRTMSGKNGGVGVEVDLSVVVAPQRGFMAMVYELGKCMYFWYVCTFGSSLDVAFNIVFKRA